MSKKHTENDEMWSVLEASELSQIDDVLINPDLERFKDVIREYQQLIDTEHPTEEELMEVINALNDEWPFHGQYGSITGMLHAWVTNEDETGQELRDVEVTDVILESRGFTIEPDSNEELPPKIMMVFRSHTLEQSVQPLIATSHDMLCAGDPNQLDITGFSHARELSQAMMDVYLPEATRHLYAALHDYGNEESNNWRDVLTALVVNVPEDNISDGVEAMVSFVNSYFDVAKKQLPIVLEVAEGMPVMAIDEEGDLTVGKATGNMARYFYPASLDLRLHCESANDSVEIYEDRLSWVLHGTTTDSEGKWVQVAVPVRSIAAIRELPPL